MKKIFKVILCLVITMLFFNLSRKEQIMASDNIIKYAKSAILIEVETGTVLYEYNAHEKLEPASMTKIMTMKLVLDAISSKRISFDDVLTTSDAARSMGGTQIYLEVGEQMKVRDLFKSMVIASANDAAVCLVEGISGNEQFFVSQMNNEVKKLGLRNTNFSNATGLPTSNHYSSSYDMAMIARNLLVNYEDEIIPYTSTYEDYVRKDTTKPFWLVNTNKLIKHGEGIDGLKTGWTETAGYCLTCTKKVDGMRLLSVVMNCDSVSHRTIDTLSLLNYGFSNYEKRIIIPKNTKIENSNNILLNPSTYSIVTSSNIVKIIKKGTNIGKTDIKTTFDIDKINNLDQFNIGKVQVFINNELIGVSELEISKKLEKNSFFNVFKEILKSLF